MFKRMAGKARGVAADLTHHWAAPAKGNFVSYKEIANLGLGGMGIQFFTIIMAYFSLSSSSTLMGATLGLQPMHMQVVGIVTSCVGVFITIGRNSMIDHTRTKIGKFRPYIIFAGIPITALAFIFVFIDFDKMSYPMKFAYATVFTFVISSILPFYLESYNSIVTVITPNSDERGKIVAINAILYSIAPTIYYFIVPILADKTGGYTDIRTYKWVIMPFTLIGLGLGMFTAFGTKERIVVPKTYIPKINTVKSTLGIFKNKYWLIMTISATIGFLEGGISNLLNWSFMYDNQNYKLMGVLNTVMGTAATIAMISAPFLIKKIGARGSLLLKEGMNIVFIFLMLLSYKNIFLFFIAWYFNQIFSSLVLVVNPVVTADIKDYHQYISGERLDMTFSTAALVTLPIGYLTGLVIPYFFESYGITQNYDILFDPMVRDNLFRVLCVLAIVGAFLQFAPLVFYDLTRTKHQNIIRVLQVRALFEDYSNGVMTDAQLCETMGQVETSENYYNSGTADLAPLMENIKRSKALPKRTKEERSARIAAIKGAKKALTTAKETMEEKKSAEILVNELHKYENPSWQYRLEQAKALTQTHISALDIGPGQYLSKAKALPEGTKQEKSFKKAEIKRARQIETMPAAIRKKYPDGIAEPDPKELPQALAMPESTKKERNAKKRAVKTAECNIKRYHTIANEYIKAQKLVLTVQSYAKLEDLRTLYHQKSERVDSEVIS